MSRYTIGIDGIEYSVEILEDAGNEARVVVNDRELRVSVAAEAGQDGGDRGGRGTGDRPQTPSVLAAGPSFRGRGNSWPR